MHECLLRNTLLAKVHVYITKVHASGTLFPLNNKNNIVYNLNSVYF